MEKKTSRPYIMMVASMLIFGTIGIFRRYIPLSSASLACVRGLLGALSLIVFVKARGGRLRHGIGLKTFLLLAFTGAVIGANWIFLFEAYNYTTVAVATLCYYMEPTIVVLLSPLVFREKLTGKKLICVSLSLIGMILVSGILSGTAPGKADVTGIVCGLSAAALYSCAVILNKKVQIEDVYEKTVIQLASAAVVLIPYLLLTETPGAVSLSAVSVIMILIVGIVHTGIAYALYFSAMQSLSAQSAAVLSYIDPVSALLLSTLFLQEKISAAGIAGAVLIIGAALLSELELPGKENGNS